MINQTQPTDSNEQNVVEFGDSPGRRLRVQRQSRGLSIERIAAQMHLKPEIIDALEQDRFEQLPDAVFVMGYLRNYARLLGLDPTPLVAAYQSRADAPKPSAPKPVTLPEDGDSGGTRALVRLVSLALAAAVVAMVAFWWHDRAEVSPEPPPELTEETPVGQADPLALEDAADPFAGSPAGVEQVPEGTPESDPAEPATASPLPPPLVAGALEPAPSIGQDDPPGPIPTQAADPSAPETPAEASDSAVAADAPKGIILEFTGPTWVDVTDAAGTRVFMGEMKAGDRREVTGQAPFRFTIGRVGNTRMTVDGEAFDLDARSKGDVARFSFDPEAPQ